MPGQPVMACKAMVYAVMDKPDEMFHYFNRSIEAKENFALFLRGFQVMNKFQADPRFTELLQKMGLGN